MMSSSLRKAFWLIGLTFLSLFVAIFITVKLSVDNARPVVDPDYQEKGLLYGSYDQQYRNARQADWSLEWPGLPAKPDPQVVEVGFQVKEGDRKVDGVTFDIVVYREGAKDNTKIRLINDQKEAIRFYPGKWNIRVEAYDGFDKRIFREWNLTF